MDLCLPFLFHVFVPSVLSDNLVSISFKKEITVKEVNVKNVRKPCISIRRCLFMIIGLQKSATIFFS